MATNVGQMCELLDYDRITLASMVIKLQAELEEARELIHDLLEESDD